MSPSLAEARPARLHRIGSIPQYMVRHGVMVKFEGCWLCACQHDRPGLVRKPRPRFGSSSVCPFLTASRRAHRYASASLPDPRTRGRRWHGRVHPRHSRLRAGPPRAPRPGAMHSAFAAIPHHSQGCRRQPGLDGHEARHAGAGIGGEKSLWRERSDRDAPRATSPKR